MSLKIIMWNVQHGSATYIGTPNGRHIAIDMGASANFSPFQHLYQNGIRKLDHVTITHPHMDHIDDILNFDSLNPATFLTPNHLTENDIRGGNRNLNKDAEAKIRKYLAIKQRYNPSLPNTGDDSIKPFLPYQSPKNNLNNHSVVTTLEYGGVKVLIPGDNEASSWEELLENPDFITAITGTHVLIAAHHGRESGFHSPLFKHFRPKITLISDGRFVDTSATSRYDNVTEGWPVFSKSNNQTQQRKCVTTRNDGCIEVDIGKSSTGGGTLSVKIN